MNEGFIDVAGLERELRELWEQMGSGEQEGQQEAVTRACVHNLIVYAPGENSDAEVNSIIAEVTIQNPGRVLILLPDPSSAERHKSAWVSAQCYRTGGKREQVCCEQIMLRARGEAVQELPIILAPLVLPDLPVFLWWRSEIQEGQVFTELLEYADRVIIDSAWNTAGEQQLHKSMSILKSSITQAAFSDLEWSRLTFWRDLIARLFDSAEARNEFSEIERVEIQAIQPYSFQSLYLVSWIASALDWKPVSRISSREGKVHFECTNRNRNVEFVISSSKATLMNSNIQGIQLQSQAAKFSVAATQGSSCVEFLVYCQGRPGVRQLRKYVQQSEMSLLRQELQILGRDRTYEKALVFLQQIL